MKIRDILKAATATQIFYTVDVCRVTDLSKSEKKWKERQIAKQLNYVFPPKTAFLSPGVS